MTGKTRIFREMCAKADAERDKGQTTPEDIIRYDDICYGTDEKWQVLDVYRPCGAEGKLPVIVSFHGGGWVYGSKEIYQFYCMSLAQRGFAAVNYSYRLAPENRFPASLEDTNAVFCWIKENADKYGFDTENIFAVGDSAGAFGLAVYSCILTNPALAEEYSRWFTLPGLKLNAVALNCGLYTSQGKSQDLSEYLPEDDPETALRLLDSVSHVTKDFPPSYVMTANGDFLLGEQQLMLDALERNGVEYRYKVYGSGEQKLWHVFHCDMRLPAAAEANDEECAFFKKHII